MADPFLDYLDDLGSTAPADDRNSVLLCQAIVSVLRRHAIYPDLTRFALETLGGIDPSTQGDESVDLTLAIRLARDLDENAVRPGKGKKVKSPPRSGAV